jgi:hypothetical protein
LLHWEGGNRKGKGLGREYRKGRAEMKQRKQIEETYINLLLSIYYRSYILS